MRTIIVYFDSLNKRYLPQYNPNSDVIAPNFERLKNKSVKFDKAFVGSMPCMPARRELHTGRYNFLHREWGPIEPYDDSIFNMLKKNGVHTHLISDHLHYWEDGGATYHTQYETWEIVRGQTGDKWKGNVELPGIPDVARFPCSHSGEKVTSNWKYDWVNREYIRELKDFPQNKVFNLGCDFLQTNKDADNWLLHIETFDPHEPFYAPKEFIDLYKDNYNGKHYDWPRGEVIESKEEIDHIQTQYKALVSMCDYQLGRVLDLMDKYNMWDDTMLIVGTDHGILMSEHGWWSKNLMPYYDEIANIPLFVWDPRCKIEGESRDQLVQLIDWSPTILKFYGLEPTPDMLGKDLNPVIEHNEVIHDAILYGTFSGHVNVTDGSTTYMRAPLPDRSSMINNYTLMPCHMTKLFDVEEMKQAEYVDGFNFTKGCKVLKVPAKDKYSVARFGHLLYKTSEDKEQLRLVDDKKLEDEMIEKMIKVMQENDAPNEQYYRLGIENKINK